MHSRLVNLRLRSAVLLIAVGTTVVVLGSALMMTLLDRREFAGFGEAMWWSLQTVTTVGYGDIVPTSARGQMIAGAVMLLGIAASPRFALDQTVYIYYTTNVDNRRAAGIRRMTTTGSASEPVLSAPSSGRSLRIPRYTSGASRRLSSISRSQAASLRAGVEKSRKSVRTAFLSL